jgi:hypothetical protein
MIVLYKRTLTGCHHTKDDMSQFKALPYVAIFYNPCRRKLL